MQIADAGKVGRVQWFKIMTRRSAKQDSNDVNFWMISQHERARAIANAKCPVANARKERSVNASKQTTHPRSERTPLRWAPTAKTEVAEGDGSEDAEVAASTAAATIPRALCRSAHGSHNM